MKAKRRHHDLGRFDGAHQRARDNALGALPSGKLVGGDFGASAAARRELAVVVAAGGRLVLGGPVTHDVDFHRDSVASFYANLPIATAQPFLLRRSESVGGPFRDGPRRGCAARVGPLGRGGGGRSVGAGPFGGG